ncbi:MAG: AraC family transcriptional regulator [Cellulophaga sp.]
MKLHLLNRVSSKNSSFTVTNNSYPYFLKIWHYHPELELVVVLKSTGTRFIGDSIEKFEEGDVVLIGKNLPHMWVNDDEYFHENSNEKAEAIAVHFREDFLGTSFFEAPEMKYISRLFNKSNQGIRFFGINAATIDKIKNLLTLSAFERTVKLIEVLHLLGKHRHYKLLSNTGFINSFNRTENKILDTVYEYVFKNFKTSISSNDVAKIANMNASAFSRFFKRIHRKTFTKYLNEIRIGYACKLLLENKYNVASVCYESGFNNISNFNRQFKEITAMSPTEYINYHTQ